MTQSVVDRIKFLELAVIKLNEQDECTFNALSEAIDGMLDRLKDQQEAISRLIAQQSKWIKGTGVAAFDELLKTQIKKASQ